MPTPDLGVPLEAEDYLSLSLQVLGVSDSLSALERWQKGEGIQIMYISVAVYPSGEMFPASVLWKTV